MKKNVFLLSVGTLLFISCNKSVDASDPDIHMNFSKQALAYVQIPPAKYFIYKDSATGDTDSVVVTKSVLDNILMPSQTVDFLGTTTHLSAYNYQTFTLLLSKVNGNTFTDWFYGTASSNYLSFYPADTDTAGVWLLEKDRSANTDKLFVFSSPYSYGNNKITISNLNIEGKNYTDVFQFTNISGILASNPNYNGPYLASTYYWAKGIGILKRSITTANSTQTWTLVRTG